MIESTSPPSIAVLLPDLRPGGAERLHLHLAEEWLRVGISVEFVLRRSQGELIRLLPPEATVVDLAAIRVRNLLPPLVRYLRKARPDALLAAMWPLTVIAPLAARLARFQGRVVVSEHSPLSIAYAHRGPLHRTALRMTQRFAYPLADARIAVSRGVADDLAWLSGLPREQFDVVHNPAARGRFPDAEHVPEAIASACGPVILAVGMLKKVKRHDLLIDAFARLPSELGAMLCILGEGPERAALEAQIATRGLLGRVLLPGFVDHTGCWYANSHVFVLSSDYEGFGNVLVEAMEHSLPIVSTDCPVGPAEILCNGRYGQLVPAGDPVALADALMKALQAPVNREELQARARDFSVGKIANRYLDVLLPGWQGSAA
jgi:glycosyltransferase involved in cell wall biosynthesis